MAQVDYFLKLDGIEGESADSKHKGEIELESFSWGEHQTGTHAAGGGGGAGKVAMQDLSIVMKSNKSSPKLLLFCANGEHIKKAVLTCRKAGKDQQEYLKVTLSDILVSSYQTAGNQVNLIPMDQVSLNFAKIEVEYKEQKPDGTLGGATKAGWDLKANKSV
jgi:type VI secretion system secreted protein Hcp